MQTEMLEKPLLIQIRVAHYLKLPLFALGLPMLSQQPMLLNADAAE